jgi:hypothetical protein
MILIRPEPEYYLCSKTEPGRRARPETVQTCSDLCWTRQTELFPTSEVSSMNNHINFRFGF